MPPGDFSHQRRHRERPHHTTGFLQHKRVPRFTIPRTGHRYTLPQIKTFLAEQQLAFLGFELPPQILEAFQQRYPEPAALLDLDRWHEFETVNPNTFLGMYIFKVATSV